jgi:hypothetical protein
MIERMKETWQVAGAAAGRRWLASIDPSKPVVPQINALIAHEANAAGGGAQATTWGVDQHTCTWTNAGARGACIEGCDAWFESALEVVNAALGCNVQVQTLDTMGSGGVTCARKIWQDAG